MWRRLRPARGAIAFSAALVLLALLWVGARAAMPTDGAPLLTDNGYAGGFMLDSPPGSSLVREDVVRVIDGASIDDALRGDAKPSAPFRAGVTRHYEVLRGGESVEVVVELRSGGLVGTRIRDTAAVLFIGLVLLGFGGWAVWHRPEHPAARALLVLGAGFSSYTVFQALGSEVAMLGERRWVFAAGIAGAVGSLAVWSTALAHLALSFPEPIALLRRRPRLPAIAYAVALVITAGLQGGAIVAGVATRSLLAGLYGAMEVVLYALVAAALVGFARTIWRAVRDEAVRNQGVLVAVGIATTLVVVAVVNLVAGDQRLPAWFPPLAFLPMSGAVTTAIVRGEFLDLRATINRALVFTSLTAGLLGVYGAVVLVVGSLVGNSGLAATIPATGVVAIAFAPARALLQRGVDRLLYGHRSDPARLLTELGRRLDAALPAEDVLPVVAETIATSLLVPYVGIRVEEGNRDQLACDRGDPTANMVTFPLRRQDRLVGSLVVAPRRGQRSLSPDDRTLLTDIARQVATVVDASRLVTELAASRGRLAVAREEERAQLRRDLHDRLGPRLVGLGLQLDTLGARANDTSIADAAHQARSEAEQALEEIRRLARGLRPADLDDVGLVAAVEAAARRLTQDDGDRWTVRVEAAVHLPTIPPDVAAAGYQIVCEALTNAHRHSGGSAARVRIGVSATGSHLIVEVSDDGQGFPDDIAEGVGLQSMRHRAAAVDGTLTISRSEVGGGATVRAELPM
ncbi:MAG: hypothetical protein QOF21_13 [Actinomycetota bacterium]|jgi:signal transduction histidine kinase